LGDKGVVEGGADPRRRGIVFSLGAAIGLAVCASTGLSLVGCSRREEPPEALNHPRHFSHATQAELEGKELQLFTHPLYQLFFGDFNPHLWEESKGDGREYAQRCLIDRFKRVLEYGEKYADPESRKKIDALAAERDFVPSQASKHYLGLYEFMGEYRKLAGLCDERGRTGVLLTGVTPGCGKTTIECAYSDFIEKSLAKNVFFLETAVLLPGRGQSGFLPSYAKKMFVSKLPIGTNLRVGGEYFPGCVTATLMSLAEIEQASPRAINEVTVDLSFVSNINLLPSTYFPPDVDYPGEVDLGYHAQLFRNRLGYYATHLESPPYRGFIEGRMGLVLPEDLKSSDLRKPSKSDIPHILGIIIETIDRNHTFNEAYVHYTTTGPAHPGKIIDYRDFQDTKLTPLRRIKLESMPGKVSEVKIHR